MLRVMCGAMFWGNLEDFAGRTFAGKSLGVNFPRGFVQKNVEVNVWGNFPLGFPGNVWECLGRICMGIMSVTLSGRE